MEATICNLISMWADGKGELLNNKPYDWSAIYKELSEQSIVCLFADLAIDFVSDELGEQWFNLSVHNMYRFSEIQNAQHDLYELLSAHNIEMAVLKGTAAAVNYPKPEYRAMGDIDFLVPIEKFDEAHQLMLSNGYTMAECEEHADYHYTLKKEGITFEIHRYPAGMKKNDEYLFGLFQNGLRKIQLVQCEGYEVPILPELQNGLVLLLHIVNHLEGGLGFRQVIDWMMFVDKHIGDDVYTHEFKSVFEKVGLDFFAKIVTRMCQIYLGLRQDITWCSEADESTCSTLLDYFYTQGNFGVKVSGDSDVKGATFFAAKPHDFFKKIQKHGLRNWDFARKHTWARPFAWIYQIFRYIKLLVCGEYNMQRLKVDLSDGAQRRKIKESLKIFQ